MGWICVNNKWVWKEELLPRKSVMYRIKNRNINPRTEKQPTTPQNQNKQGQYGFKVNSEQLRWAGDMYQSLYRAYTQKFNLKHDDAVRMARFGVSHEAEESGYGSSNRSKNNNYGGFTTGNQKFNNMDDFTESYARTMLYTYPTTLNAKNLQEYVHGLYVEKWEDGTPKLYNADKDGEVAYYNRINGNWDRSQYGIDWWLQNNSATPNKNFTKIEKYH